MQIKNTDTSTWTWS